MAVAIAEDSTVCLPNLQPLWHEKVPARLVKKCPDQDPVAGWSAWQKYLRSRKQPQAPPFLTKRQPPILWGWPAQWEREQLKAAIESPTSLAEAIIGDDAVAAPDLPLSLQMVALAYALPRLSRELPAETWWNLIERLHAVATQASTQRVETTSDPREVVRNQLLAGELPLALSCLFPEVRALRELRDGARSALSEAILELTDGRGLLHIRLLGMLGPLFACWTRVRWLGSKMSRGPWSREAEIQYQWVVRQAIRLADVDGRFVLTPQVANDAAVEPAAKSWTKDIFAKALELAGDRSDCAAAAGALPHGVVPKNCKKIDSGRGPDPSLNSDWAGISILADGWSQSAARLAVAYTADPVTIELAVDGERLLAGAWTFNTTCDGQPVHAVSEWEQLCWETGKRFDYLELGLQLSDGLRLERQILFGRDDRVLFLADNIAISDGASRHVQHTFNLPLASDSRWQPEVGTRDGVIACRKAHAAVLPLALSEWRTDPRGGSLEIDGGNLVLTQSAHGRALCGPLLLDLNRKRSQQERTWRQLTIGENMEVLPRDVAVGFRAQSGRDQWLFYRSLGPVGNRTVLGQNFSGEFSAGAFCTTGKYKDWIEIEAVE